MGSAASFARDLPRVHNRASQTCLCFDPTRCWSAGLGSTAPALAIFVSQHCRCDADVHTRRTRRAFCYQPTPWKPAASNRRPRRAPQKLRSHHRHVHVGRAATVQLQSAGALQTRQGGRGEWVTLGKSNGKDYEEAQKIKASQAAETERERERERERGEKARGERGGRCGL